MNMIITYVLVVIIALYIFDKAYEDWSWGLFILSSALWFIVSGLAIVVEKPDGTLSMEYGLITIGTAFGILCGVFVFISYFTEYAPWSKAPIDFGNNRNNNE